MVADQLTDNVWMMDRGDHSNISTCISKAAIDNEFSGNMIDVCPVGALTDKTFRFKSRLVQQAVHCTEIVTNVLKQPFDVWRRNSKSNRT
jgi:hypothetical protein